MRLPSIVAEQIADNPEYLFTNKAPARFDATILPMPTLESSNQSRALVEPAAQSAIIEL
jgi:hypothetical protein